MRHAEVRFVDDGVTEQDQVEIQRPRGACVGALAARFPLNRQQLAEQRAGIERRLPDRDGVQKTRLVARHADRIGFVN